jgi:hypothetical protein
MHPQVGWYQGLRGCACQLGPAGLWCCTLVLGITVQHAQSTNGTMYGICISYCTRCPWFTQMLLEHFRLYCMNHSNHCMDNIDFWQYFHAWCMAVGSVAGGDVIFQVVWLAQFLFWDPISLLYNYSYRHRNRARLSARPLRNWGVSDAGHCASNAGTGALLHVRRPCVVGWLLGAPRPRLRLVIKIR